MCLVANGLFLTAVGEPEILPQAASLLVASVKKISDLFQDRNFTGVGRDNRCYTFAIASNNKLHFQWNQSKSFGGLT
jgi:hypothetical protein